MSVGTAGRVRTYRTGTGWRARTLYRDYDGITRDLERAGKTRGAAERALAEALRDRVRIIGTDVISGDTRVAVLYKMWFSQLVDHSPTTTAAYEYIADRHIIPALGSLRVRELSVGTIHRFLRSVADHHGAATAKICKSILSGICGLATRHDALDRNPVRDVGPLGNGVQRRLGLLRRRKFASYLHGSTMTPTQWSTTFPICWPSSSPLAAASGKRSG